MEILVVIAVIGILITALVATAVKMQARAKRQATLATFKMIQAAAIEYKDTLGEWPEEQTFDRLWNGEPGQLRGEFRAPDFKLVGPFLDVSKLQVIVAPATPTRIADAWGNPILFDRKDTNAELGVSAAGRILREYYFGLTSYGPDGQNGTTDDIKEEYH
jgi:type II secretory pathway pseudopilin PulG